MTARSLRTCVLSLAAVAAAAGTMFTIVPTAPADAATVTNGQIAYCGAGHIYVANADGTAPYQLADGSGPSWSVDGQRLGYVGTNGYYTTVSPDGSNPQTLQKFGVTWPGLSPALSPDGSKIAYWDQTTQPNGDGSENIWIHTFATNRDVDILQRTALDRYPTWSPDGTKIAFQTDSATSPRLAIMNADGTNAHVIPNQPAGDSTMPRFSPDGAKVVFSNDPVTNGIHSASTRLYVIGVDGSGLQQVGATDRVNSGASFSPDGTKILYSSWGPSFAVDTATGLYVMDADGTNATQITHGDNSCAAWQPVGGTKTNLLPHPYGTVKQKGTHLLQGNGTLAFDDDGWIVKYEWRWGDYTPVTTGSIAWHRYAAAGTYLVRLTVYDNNGGIGTRKAWITVT